MKKIAALMGIAAIPAALSAQNKPNIIWIMTDQHTATALSCAGNPDVKTPNIDRLAANGILFRNAYCTSTVSGPSRSAMFTGYYPSHTGMQRNGDNLPPEYDGKTLGDYVSAAGYECAYGGKWHVHESSIPDGTRGFRNIHNMGDHGLAEACVGFINSKHRKPFFLVASFDNPHNVCEFAREQNLPYGNLGEIPKEEWVGLPLNFARNPYDADVIQYEKSRNYFAYPTANYTPDDWRRYRTYYFRLVQKVDAEVGKIVDAIDAANLWKNTVVIFTSDHGDGTGAHQWNQKSALYEEVINIPFIITLPGKKNAGSEFPQLVSNGVDLFASVCEWTGADSHGQGGKSLKSLVEKGTPETPHQDYIVVETMFDKGDNSRGWCVRSPKYKYVMYDKGRYREQLFDMEADRGEMRNLAVEGRYRDVLNEYRAILDKWMSDNDIKQIRAGLRLVKID